MSARLVHVASIVLAAVGLPALGIAQQVIDPTHAFSWQENCGHMFWETGQAGTGGGIIHVAPTFLSGSIWCENIGWVLLGDGPSDGVRYRNTTDQDFGVNIDPATHRLFGFAWSENAAWVNFAGGALASPPNPARLDLTVQRFRGYAWGTNIGWINLDDELEFVGTRCIVDVDDGSSTGTPDGGVTIDDLLYYLFQFEVGDIVTDIDDGNGTGTPDGGVTIDDLLYFLQRFEAGC